MEQRRQDAEGAHHAAGLVRDRCAHVLWEAIRLAGHGHQAGPRLAQDVEGAELRLRPLTAVAGGARVDDPFVHVRNVAIGDTEPLGHAEPVVGEKDVGVAGEAQEHLSPFRVLQIESDRALPTIERLEVAAEAAQPLGTMQAAARIANQRFLDLDHIRAQIGQHGGRSGPLLPDRHIENTDAF